MNNIIFKTVSSLFLIGLVVINVAIFVTGMKLSETINYYEFETRRLHQENLELEQSVYEAQSLQKAASVAAELGFSKKAEPLYLNNLGVALKR